MVVAYDIGALYLCIILECRNMVYTSHRGQDIYVIMKFFFSNNHLPKNHGTWQVTGKNSLLSIDIITPSHLQIVKL